MRRAEPCGDEVWDVGSSCSDHSDASADSDVELQDGCLTQKSVAPVQLSNGGKADSETESDDSQSESGEVVSSKDITLPCPLSERGCQEHLAKLPLPAKQFVAKLPPPEAAPKSARGQVTYLRRENELLRSAIAQLQKEAEKVAQEASEESKSLDFAHLLELARDFGEDFGICAIPEHNNDWYGENSSTAAPDSINISTPDSSPRCEKQSLPNGNSDVAELQAQLDKSRCEVSQLKAQISVLDSELAKLRQAGGATL